MLPSHESADFPNLRRHYSRSLPPGRLHFAAHSHHPWPDVTRDATLAYWDDAANALDRKWAAVFETLLPTVQSQLADWLGFDHPARIAFGGNTLDLVFRVISPLLTRHKKISVLTTDSEFHSWDRLITRLSEAQWQVTRVPQFPLETFDERWQSAIASQAWDVIFVSQVFFNTGFAPPRILPPCLLSDTLMIVDGYHGAGALDFRFRNWGPITDKIFYVGGGYKYLQSGEGAAFLMTPNSFRAFAPEIARPLTTGWLTDFAHVSSPHPTLTYGNGGFRYIGATFDPTGLYRMRAVFDFFKSEKLNPASVRNYVQSLQRHFLENLPAPWSRNLNVIVKDATQRGSFIAFSMPSHHAAKHLTEQLNARNCIVDFRTGHAGSVLRVGFGIYQTIADVDAFTQQLLQCNMP